MSDQPPSGGQGGDRTPEDAMGGRPAESPAGETGMPSSGDYFQQAAAPPPSEPDPAATIRMS
jgi:hypothetical protein